MKFKPIDLRNYKRHIFVFVLTSLMLASLVTASKITLDSVYEQKIEDKVLKTFENQSKVTVIVRTKKDAFLDSVSLRTQILSELAKENYKFKGDLIDGFAIEVTEDGFQKLKQDPTIDYIYADRKVHAARDQSVPLINIDDVWNFVPSIRGNGQTICVIDSGIDYTHPDFGNCSLTEFINGDCGKVPSGFDFVNDDNHPYDDNGHGTHIAGIVAGNGTVNGTSPDAKIIALKVLDSNGDGTILDVGKAIKWCTDNSTKYNISVISISIGTEDTEYGDNGAAGPCISTIDNEINNATNSGIPVIVSSGNDGFKNGISYPACSPNAISVGATYDSLNLPPEIFLKEEFPFVECIDWKANTDDLTCFTNRGNNLDLLAPGDDITSTVPTDSCELCASSGYKEVDGTSMAAPHVSGTAALMLQKADLLGYNLTPDEIEDMLANTANIIVDDKDESGFSFPRIDALAAFNALDIMGLDETITGTVWYGRNWTERLQIPNKQDFVLSLSLSEDLEDLRFVLTQPNGTEHVAGRSPTIQSFTVQNPSEGVWTAKVSGADLDSGDRTTFKLQSFAISPPPEDVEEKFDPNKPGGINFTNANLNYISTCNPSDDLEVVMQATEANQSAGDVIINITNATVQATDAFLTGLIIPDHNMWVTMDTKEGPGFGGKVGDVSRVDETLAKTEVGKVMFDADIQLKLDTFGQSQALLEGLINGWVANVSGNPKVVPGWYARMWISPKSLTANGSDCKIWLTNSSLKVESNVDGVWVSGDYESELGTFRTKLSDGLSEIASDTESKINNDSDDTYEDLRRVYTSIALAQWYKQQPREKAVFSDLIDSNNISGLDIGFDQAYYEQQAWQHLYTFYYSGNWYYTVYGGVEMTDTQTNVEDSIANATSEKVSDVLTTSYVQEDNEYYFSTLIEAEKPNIKPLALSFTSLNPVPIQAVNVSVAVENAGKVNASNFSVYFYHTTVHLDGSRITELIGEANVTNLIVDEIELINISWTTPAILGDYNITAVTDYNNTVEESNELDNIVAEMVTVHNSYPTASILSPNANNILCGVTTFTGSGSDPQDGSLGDNSLNWSSDIDGYFGNGSSVEANLSIGVHEISLTASDSEGFTDTASMPLNVVACNDPVPAILSPLDNGTYAEGETVYFTGEAADEEDGIVPNASLSWNSSLDGSLGTGGSLSSKTLTVGDHTITLTAVDVTSLQGFARVNITVEEGTPSVSINSPQNNEVFNHKTVVSFDGSSIDPQDGDISSDIVWTSSIEGDVGVGDFSTNLSVGLHTITATIIDSHGLSNSTHVNITIRPPQYPESSIIFPKHTKTFIHGNNVTFQSTYIDFEDGTIANASLIWNSSIDGIFENGTDFVYSNFSIGNHTIYFTVTDSDDMATAAQVNITVNPAPPVPSIVSPAHGDIFAEIADVIFNGTASDYEDGNLSSTSLNWTSNKDGYLGEGSFLNLTNLAVGTHLITLKATDSNGLNTETSVNIIVVGKSQTLVNKLLDGSTIKNITYTAAGNKTEYVVLPKAANVSYAAINIKGHSP